MVAPIFKSGENEISSAKQVKIKASEIGMGWNESFNYMNNPVNAIEELHRQFEEKDLLELSIELRRDGVKDGYFFFLQKIDKPPRSLIEVDAFVFNNISGARKFFEYMKNKTKGTSISGIGDEAAIYSTETETTHIWLVRTSNAYIKVIVWDGKETGKETGRIIAEKIVEKATKC